MIFKGNVHKYGDNINTDVIIPTRYCNTIVPGELALHCLADLDAGFVKKVKPNDIITAGCNFGCGSSREVAPIAIKASGISCVISKSFARIFYRNSINIGLPIIECPGCVEDVSDGHLLEVKFSEGVIYNTTLDKSYRFSRGNPVIENIIMSGGLVNYTKQRLKKKK
jgi:3-isopropylmalate/(R)-2-methylmalate dehydratase small subunit